MTQTFLPDEMPATADEEKDLTEILDCIRLLREETGWGVIELTFKGGELNEVITSISRKPKTNN
jgi:hypothetical protein